MLLTPLQQKLFDVLADGQEHELMELLRLVDETSAEMMDTNCLRTLLSTMRQALPAGLYLHFNTRAKAYRLLCNADRQTISRVVSADRCVADIS